MRFFTAVLLILLMTFALGDYLVKEQEDKKIALITPKDANAQYEKGFLIYKAHCQNCHGKHADGKGKFPGLENHTPTDFTSAAFDKTPKEMRQVIRDGGLASGLDPLMPKWDTILSETEIRQVVYFIYAVHEEGEMRKRIRTR